MDRETIIKYYNQFTSQEFDEKFTYEGNDLGAVWSKGATQFRLWAPTAEQVLLNLYQKGADHDDRDPDISGCNDPKDLSQQLPMISDVRGTWVVEVEGDLNGVYYTYSVTTEGRTRETVDPYAKAAGVNGNRGMVIDLAQVDPEGFRTEKRPEFAQPTDAVIYEVHVRDFSIDLSSGMTHKGKFLAFTETGTVNEYGDSTGLDYLVELGITHVHLLPVFDYATVDETQETREAATGVDNQYNWGYDPKNYNVLEGSYSTDP